MNPEVSQRDAPSVSRQQSRRSPQGVVGAAFLEAGGRSGLVAVATRCPSCSPRTKMTRSFGFFVGSSYYGVGYLGPGGLPSISMGPKDHINIRILHPGSKAQDKEDFRSHGLEDPYVYMVSWGPKQHAERKEPPMLPRIWA